MKVGKTPDEEFMRIALGLAVKGMGRVSPNPLVGCVIVKNNRVVGSGYHRRFGGAHAEINALRDAGMKAAGATMYVTLEPCCHYGKTGPCTKAIIDAGIRRVIAAMPDPNPKIRKRGFMELRKAGIMVYVGLLREEAEKTNECYITYMREKRPFVLIKAAMSLDGKISYGNCRNKRISGKKSRKLTAMLRSRMDAVLVGLGTVRKDNPRLTARTKMGQNPLRVIVDSRARSPLNAAVFREQGKAVVACTSGAPQSRIKRLAEMGIGTVVVRKKNGRVELKSLLRELGKAGISSVLVEGGASVLTSFVKEGLFDRMLLFVSPKIIGKGLCIFNDERLMKKLELKALHWNGEDIIIEVSSKGK